MVSSARVKTGDIWLACLDPTVGSEIQKTRPCVVVSPAEMHDFLRTVIVAPMTTGSRPAGFRIPISFQGKAGLILLDQVRTLDKSRLHWMQINRLVQWLVRRDGLTPGHARALVTAGLPIPAADVALVQERDISPAPVFVLAGYITRPLFYAKMFQNGTFVC